MRGPIDPEHEALPILAGVLDWARPFLRGEAPPFGTADWLSLPLDDPRRTAAIVRAALAWWRVGQPVDEVLFAAAADADKHASAAISAALDWTEQSYRPTHAEVTRRRAQLPDDYREITPDTARASWASLDTPDELTA